MQIRVMAWNVHGFRAGIRAVADAVAGDRPDVLLLNETGYLGVALWRFSRRTGMRRASGAGRWRPIPNAVLVRAPWRIVRSAVIRFPRSGRTVRRGAVTSVVGRAGWRLAAAAVHLGLREGERLDHARVLGDALAARPEALVIGGDLNETPDGRAATWLRDRFWDAFAGGGSGEGATFPASRPHARIDYLLVSGGVRVLWCAVGGTTYAEASDHRPVLADLEIS